MYKQIKTVATVIFWFCRHIAGSKEAAAESAAQTGTLPENVVAQQLIPEESAAGPAAGASAGSRLFTESYPPLLSGTTIVLVTQSFRQVCWIFFWSSSETGEEAERKRGREIERDRNTERGGESERERERERER